MPMFPSVDEQLAVIRRGVEEILPEEALREKLERSYKTGKPLIVKLGCDPSRPDLHIGHAVVLRKLREFQDLGHQAVLIVGDFTAMIGDPSGKSKTRPALTIEETRAHGQTYFEQAGKVLDLSRARVVYNSEWLNGMSFRDVIQLAAKYTVARMMERDEFSKRYTAGEPISVHEFLYPLAQAQDSVAIEADVELGGTDQKFNLLVGREVQARSGMESQVCITLPILEGTDGVDKMSKSLGNYIGLTDSPQDMYGKTVSIPDALIYRYFVLATDAPAESLPELKAYAERDPRNAKHDLAYRITAMYHGEEGAKAAREHFERTIIRKEEPEEMPEFTLGVSEEGMGILAALTAAHLAASNGEARRLIQQGGVYLNGERVADPASLLTREHLPAVFKVGKRRYARVSA